MTAYPSAFQLYDTAPITLADHPPSLSTSRSRYHAPSPRTSPRPELVERHPRSIKPVQLSTEFLLKPQSQSHSNLAPHFLSFQAARLGKASNVDSTLASDELEGGSISRNVDPWLTTSNSMNAQDSQMQTSMGNIEAYSGPGDYLSPVEVHPTMFPLPPAPLLPHPEYLYRNQCVIPVHISPTAAHQPIPPEQHSTYSELAPHLEFMAKMQQQELSPQPIDAPTRKARQPSRLSPRARNHRQSTYPSPIERSRRLERRSGSSDILVENKSRVPRSRYASLPPSEREPNQESSDASEGTQDCM